MIDIVYPRVRDTVPVPRAVDPIAARDSTFLFGSVGRGDAHLTVNGVPVPVRANGAWLAWVPLPRDTVAQFDLIATAGTDTVRRAFMAGLPVTYTPPPFGPWVDTLSLRPRGDWWVRPAEGVRLAVRATPGATVAMVLHDGQRIPMVPVPRPADVPWGVRAFGVAAPEDTPPETDRYEGWLTGPAGPDPGLIMAPWPAGVDVPTDTLWARVEVITGLDTARARWPLRLGVVDIANPMVVVVDDDTARTGTSDLILPGRPAPNATYHWFFPNGTRAAVSGRVGDQVRLQLSAATVAWVNVSDIQALPPGTPPPGGTMQSLRLFPGDRSVTLRVPLPARIPFRMDEDGSRLTLTLYGVAASADWIQYGGTDPFVTLIAWHQPREDEVRVTVDLTRDVWGYRTRWEGNDLLLEVRRPPTPDRRHPLRGRVIAIDPGHPPVGSTGPTRLFEGDAMLAVADRLRVMLEAEGARVVQLRTTQTPMGLIERTAAAEAAEGEALVSIHANALPDGVNPFTNHGTSTYYYHPRSRPLATAIQRALVAELGLRDLGVGRGDLHLARPTWMPAILAEGLFIMIPEQEAMLASPHGQAAYARGLRDGLLAFFREQAR
jgi:N-acetylmuramoyl-L-alanine amidase